jgi:hypothetical protein
MLKILKSILNNALEKATEVLGAVPEWVSVGKVMKVPANKHPIKAIIVAYKNKLIFCHTF